MSILGLFAILISHVLAPQANAADRLNGYWISPDKDLIVKCYKGTDGLYHGKLVWFKIYPGDKEKYDCDITQEQWINQVVLAGFGYDKNEWNGGVIKDIKKCNTYDAFIQLQPDGKLKATGFIFFRWLSESITFSRYSGELPTQH